jgi:hypothetical protein
LYNIAGITEKDGMCIADEIDLKAFRDFFIQLDLPFKATRFELFNVKATIFNYGMPNDGNKTVSMTLYLTTMQQKTVTVAFLLECVRGLVNYKLYSCTVSCLSNQN